MIEEGKYRALATEAKLGRTGTGKEYIRVWFNLPDEDVTLSWDGYFTEKTQERTIESLRTAGWMGDDISNVTFENPLEVIVVVQNEEYEKDGVTKTYSKVAFVNKPGGGPGVKNELSGAEALSFAEKMRGAVLAYDAKNPKKGSGVPF